MIRRLIMPSRSPVQTFRSSRLDSDRAPAPPAALAEASDCGLGAVLGGGLGGGGLGGGVGASAKAARPPSRPRAMAVARRGALLFTTPPCLGGRGDHMP